MIVHADADSNGQGADEVTRSGENNWELQAYFPYRLKEDRVDGDYSEVIGIESLDYHAQVGTGPDYHDYEGIEVNSLTPSPQDLDQGYSYNTSFGISAGIDLSPVPFLSTGMTMNYSFDVGGSSYAEKGYNYNGVQWDTNNYGFWHLELNDSWRNIPKKPEEDGAWSVNFDVRANPQAQNQETIVPKSQPNMYYYAYENGVCPSSLGGYVTMYRDGPLASAPNTFNVVDPNY